MGPGVRIIAIAVLAAVPACGSNPTTADLVPLDATTADVGTDASSSAGSGGVAATHGASNADVTTDGGGGTGGIGLDAGTGEAEASTLADGGQSCESCGAEQYAACLKAFEACYGDIGCQNIYACTLVSCGLDAVGADCTNACFAGAAVAAQAKFKAYHSCVFCQACTASCATYCAALNWSV